MIVYSQNTKTLAAPGVTDWLLIAEAVAVQVTGSATAATVQLERSATNPDGGAAPSPIGADRTGNPSTGMAVFSEQEAGAAWYRARLKAITGASVTIAVNGVGASQASNILADRSMLPAFRRLRLSSLAAAAGATFTATILDRTAGSMLLLAEGDDRFTLAGETLTGKRLKPGVEEVRIIERAGTSGIIGDRETLLRIAVAQNPDGPLFPKGQQYSATATTSFTGSGTTAAVRLSRQVDIRLAPTRLTRAWIVIERSPTDPATAAAFAPVGRPLMVSDSSARILTIADDADGWWRVTVTELLGTSLGVTIADSIAPRAT